MATNDLYFNNLPVINYNGMLSIDITTRAAIYDQLTQDISQFFPYTIPDGWRADEVAYNQYQDANLDWLIYLVNNITDPYYGWPLSDNQLNAMVDQRFGSVERASILVSTWVNNYFADPTVLTVAQYNALASTLKQFYAPQLMGSNIIQQYVRRVANTEIDSNVIARLTFPSAKAASAFYSEGDILIDQNNSANYGEVTRMDPSGTFVTLKNVFGSWTTTGGSYTIGRFLYNNESNIITSNTTISSVVDIIPSSFLSFYEPLTQYQNQLNINELNKFIILLQPQFVQSALNLVGELFS